MKQPKISVLTPYYAPVKGGVSSYVSNLVTTLNKFNFSTLVIARYGTIDENVFMMNNKMLFIIKSYLILHKEKPTVVHAHSNWYTLATSFLYKTIHPKTRIVFTFHTEPLGKMKGSKRIIFQWLLSKCDVITCVSKALMEKIEDNYKLKGNKKVIYAGVSTKKVSESEIRQFEKKYSLENNSPIISFIGPLVWKQKVEGVKILIRSFKIIEAEYPDSKLLIIGDGMYKKELQQLTDKLNINNVIFTGFLNNVFVPLSVTDIYAHISLQEGFPISLLEAMSAGKPVIAANIGGIPEIIVNDVNGVLVEPDLTKIADEILKLYDDKEKCRNIAKNAILTVEKEYNWNRITEKFIDIYNS